VASTASPFICGAPPSPDASLRVIAAVSRSLAMAVAEIASFGGVAGNGGRQENPFSFDATVGASGWGGVGKRLN
jgi:hypothetical protein